jgi:hypothetical protein
MQQRVNYLKKYMKLLLWPLFFHNSPITHVFSLFLLLELKDSGKMGEIVDSI